MGGPHGGAPWTGIVDDIDARIIAALIKDARTSYALIGQEVGLSAPAVKRRVGRLRASGAITGFSARVDPAALGWTTEAYVELFCSGRTTPDVIAAAVRRYPEVADEPVLICGFALDDRHEVGNLADAVLGHEPGDQHGGVGLV